MPTIFLKPNSPEFEETEHKNKNTPSCDMPSCLKDGDHKAPRDRSLSDHHHFCSAHITDYNRAWNFFEGMNPAEVEEHVTSAFYGDRPTWKYREFTTMEEELYRRVHQNYEGTTSHEEKEDTTTYTPFEQHSPEMNALSIIGLSPPITLEEIKKEYKILAKRYHPDHNHNDPESEDLLKGINMAYTILKAAYGKYESLMAK